MKKVKQAIVLVDVYRRPSRCRNTQGRYRVGAKTEKEAVELVQKAIGFGSVQFYYWDDWDDHAVKTQAAYKEVLQEHPNGYRPARHACAPQNTY